MKYLVLSLAALVIPSLSYPSCYRMPYLSRPAHPLDAGEIPIFNVASFGVNVDEEPQGNQYYIPPGQHISVAGAQEADIKFNEETEVSYVSGNDGTFNYVINPIGENPQLCIHVSPNGCGSLNWCPGDPPTPPVTCNDGTELYVTLYPPQ
ncbi:hypothetical protein BGW36DRAFT_309487 [Talaromyces proteolyticus]|uniref:Uncharacterized protein n=1 Tax=Talaromyces proteolyticus TaxID=1131652 RepID=A0AAD4KD40_9EURO|nr:uncharacterized protein BGW36DRAFT_309487 [Talaromyces proteolyticus]KAH8688776.1 hypothetical protein BGW36DRAFT_309487 [Talaromyces proteolyticus]